MKRYQRRLALTLSIFLCFGTLGGCSFPSFDSSSDEPVTQNLFAMDTVMTVSAYGSHAQKGVDDAVAEIKRLDQKLSISSNTGEIVPINEHGTGKVSAETADLLRQSLQICKDTNGTYDITILPVMELWGFTTQKYTVPDPTVLAKTRKLVDYRKVKLSSDGTVTLPKGMGLDLGGIAKGYTSDQLMQVFRADGITSGIVSLGGNVQTLGSKPDGTPWRVAVQDPDNLNDYLGTLTVRNKAVTTAGGYQRYFEKNGVRYWHIIDPATGYPARTGLNSVTVVSDSGTLSDGIDTPLFIMGMDKALAYWRAHKNFELIFVKDDDSVAVTPGLKDTFQMKDSSKTFTVVS